LHCIHRVEIHKSQKVSLASIAHNQRHADAALERSDLLDTFGSRRISGRPILSARRQSHQFRAARGSFPSTGGGVQFEQADAFEKATEQQKMSIKLSIASLLCAVAMAPMAQAQLPNAGEAADLQDKARELTELLAAHKIAAVVSYFDEAMVAAMPVAKLTEVWDGTIAQNGAFQTITDVAPLQDVQGYQVAVVTAKFEKATLNLRWVFDSKERVGGLYIVPMVTPEAASKWTPPDYAHLSSFHELPVTVGDSPWQLPGTLTLPNGNGPFPAVVLVAGSGPQDQDESISGNKPLKDIAWGLASQGIAVLRYNKRTLQYAEQIKLNDAGFTVNQETVDDARAAVSLLSARLEVDSRRIFVLGHSLGGMLAPRIAQDDPQVAGLVILAGTTRPLERVMVEQIRYIDSLQGKVTPARKKQIDDAQAFAKEVESPQLTADERLEVMGSTIPGSYFLDLRDYHPAEVAATLGIPILVLRGDRDYQVTQEDFDGWKKSLSGRPNVTFKLYPGLFHLFMPSSSSGSGLGTPADYQKPGHVVAPVIDDIAAWIKSQKPPATSPPAP
jgi:dienelactone hydrolase